MSPPGASGSDQCRAGVYSQGHGPGDHQRSEGQRGVVYVHDSYVTMDRVIGKETLCVNRTDADVCMGGCSFSK